jgi:hypothetical protein
MGRRSRIPQPQSLPLQSRYDPPAAEIFYENAGLQQNTVNGRFPVGPWGCENAP